MDSGSSLMLVFLILRIINFYWSALRKMAEPEITLFVVMQTIVECFMCTFVQNMCRHNTIELRSYEHKQEALPTALASVLKIIP